MTESPTPGAKPGTSQPPPPGDGQQPRKRQEETKVTNTLNPNAETTATDASRKANKADADHGGDSPEANVAHAAAAKAHADAAETAEARVRALRGLAQVVVGLARKHAFQATSHCDHSGADDPAGAEAQADKDARAAGLPTASESAKRAEEALQLAE